jgi:hypothetical protein
MIADVEHEHLRREALEHLGRAGVRVSEAEAAAIEVADLGLGRPREIGLQLLVYVNTERCCAKELVLLPLQLCPEHRHPPFDGSLQTGWFQDGSAGTIGSPRRRQRRKPTGIQRRRRTRG